MERSPDLSEDFSGDSRSFRPNSKTGIERDRYMPIYVKSVLAAVFLISGLVAVICGLTLMGRAERKISATFLRRTHKGAGAVFLLLFLVISYFCLKYVAEAVDQLSVRAVFHGVLALALLVVLLLKLSLVQFYRQFLRYVPGLGMTVFALSFVVFSTSAGYFFLSSTDSAEAGKRSSTASIANDAQKGRMLFDNKCSFCHHADRRETKIGPGLKDILKREKLPVSGKPATPENITQQLLNPFRDMPSFKSTLSRQEIKDLLAYLSTL